MRIVIGMAFAGLLAGCGGGSSEQGVTFSASSAKMGPSNVSASHNGSNGAYDFAANGSNLNELYYKDSYTARRSVFIAYKNDDFTQFAYGKAGNYGLASVAASDNHSSNNFAGATFSRTGTSSLPSSGTASYNGEYTGFMMSGSTASSGMDYLVRGTLALNADFANDRVSGTITNRTTDTPNYASTGPNLSNVTLSQTSIGSDGQFVGSANASGLSSTTFAGAFAGPNAAEVVGGLSGQHSNGKLEVGAFFGQ